jgi:MFS family permease
MDATNLYHVKSYDAARGQAWRAWTVVTLLFLFQAVNYADKGVTGLARAGIMRDLHLTNVEWGYIGSSFFILFPISSVVFGLVANRAQSRWLLLVMGAVWALTQFPMVGTVGLGTLYTCRILLGASEGPGFPVALHATYKWFPNTKRTLPTSLLVLGGGVGTTLAGLALPRVIEAWGWHAAFLAVGLVGVIWTLAWLALGREGKIVDEHQLSPSGERVPYVDLLLNPTSLGVFVVCFAAYWAIATGLTWGPGYLHEAVGLTAIQAGEAFTIPTVVAIFTGPLIGYASQALFGRGVASRWSRGAFGCAGVILGGAGIAAMAMAGNATASIGGFAFPLAILWFTCANVVMFTIYTVGPPILAEITPPAQRATVLAINNAIYSSAGIIAPTVMGYVLDWNKSDVLTGYRDGYLLLAAILAGCGLAGLVLMNPARDVARLRARRARLNGAAIRLSPAE